MKKSVVILLLLIFLPLSTSTRFFVLYSFSPALVCVLLLLISRKVFFFSCLPSPISPICGISRFGSLPSFPCWKLEWVWLFLYVSDIDIDNNLYLITDRPPQAIHYSIYSVYMEEWRSIPFRLWMWWIFIRFSMDWLWSLPVLTTLLYVIRMPFLQSMFLFLFPFSFLFSFSFSFIMY